MRLALLHVFFLCYFGGLLLAQEQPKVVVFNEKSNTTSKSGNAVAKSSELNLFKISLLELITGDMSMYYERGFGNKFGVELGLGLTHKNYLGYEFDDLFFDPSSASYNSLLGRSFGVGARYYLYDLFQDWFFSFDVKRRSYFWEYDHSYYDADISDFVVFYSTDNHHKINKYRFGVGLISIFGNHIITELMAGVYYQTQDMKRFDTNFNQYISNHSYNPVWFSIDLKLSYRF